MNEIWDENISNFRFLAFDTETTGSKPSSDHLVELAAMLFDEDFEHRSFETLVKPPCSIPEDVIKIHGITDEMVREAPSADLALERFAEFLEFAGSPKLMLAHNAGFDVSVLHHEAGSMRSNQSRGNHPPEIALDTCMLAKALLPDLRQHRLDSLASYFKIETGRLHRAMADVKVLAAVFKNLLGIAADQCAKVGGGLTLNALINLAGGYFIYSPGDAEARRKPFRLPPRISAIESLCGSEARVAIMYEVEQDYRYITPLAIKMKGFKVYVEAFCHRDNIKKTFRADRILRIGRIESAF